MVTSDTMSTRPGTASHRRLEDEFYRVMNKFTNKNWNQFARSKTGLCLPEYQIDDIRSDYSNDAREQKYQMLSLWRRRNGKKATLENLELLVDKFFKFLDEQERIRAPERASADNVEHNPQNDRSVTDAMTHQPPHHSQSTNQHAAQQYQQAQPQSVPVNPDRHVDRTFPDSHDLSMSDSRSESSNHPSMASHYVHSNRSLPPERATAERDYSYSQSATSGHSWDRVEGDNYSKSDGSGQGMTRPKGVRNTGSGVVRGEREGQNNASAFYPVAYPFLPFDGNSNFQITVSGKNAIGIQTNVFIGGAKVNKSNKTYEKSEKMANFCSRIIGGEVKPSQPDFYDEHLAKSDAIYKITHMPKGAVLIINNSFPGHPRDERFGSGADVQNMDSLWKDMRCKTFVRTDLTAAQSLDTLRKFASSQHASKSDFVAVVIMSHGGQEVGEDVFYGADSESVRVKEVLEAFNNANARRLQGIPKLFFFQFCRGNAVDMGVEGPSRQEEEELESLFNSLDVTVRTTSGIANNDLSDSRGIPTSRHPTMSDCMISFATQAGFRAFRNSESGSWYINAIVNVFRLYAHDQHVLDLMTMVNHAVASKTAINTEDRTVHEGKEMSDFKSTLRKKLFFFPGFPEQRRSDDDF